MKFVQILMISTTCK